MLRISGWRELIALTLAFVAPMTSAQSQAVSRTLSGVVRDTLGRPLEDAVVVLNPMGAQRATRAGAGGRFRFDRVDPGRYVMRTTWIGYEPDERTIEIPAEGLQVTIALTPVAFRLDTLTVVARRTGIFGTTVDRVDFRPLGGVDVRVMGTEHRTRTAADGRFSFGAVRFGGWVVQASRDGYTTRLVPVAVPDTAAVELALAMDSARTKGQQIANGRVREMQMRINRAQSNSSALVASQEFGARGKQTLEVALRSSPSFLIKGLRLEGKECVLVDGVPRPSILAKDILAADVAFVEVYNSRGVFASEIMEQFRDYGVECGVGPVVQFYGETGRGMKSSRPGNPATVAFISVWLK